jgi:hypothetical protein
MAFARPFAYNPGTPIPGTEQVGSLAVGTPTSGFTNNPPFWNGSDEDLGYVIAVPVSGNTQPTPVTTNRVYLSPTYKGTDVVLYNNNQTAAQIFGYQQSVLGINQIGVADKVMFSVLCTLTEPGVLADSHFVGVGYTSMNYQGNPYDGFPGNDNQSMGYGSSGTIWYNGNVYQGGLQTWGNNDIIDIVVDNNTNGLWVRVNGGNWNNNPSANPATGSNGIETIGGPFYPVLCPGYEGTMIIQNYPKYGIPSGYNFLATLSSVGFYRTNGFSDSNFINLAQAVSRTYGTPQIFSSANDASIWLTANGFWNSFIPVTPTPTPTNTQTPTPTPTPTNTQTPTGTAAITPTPSVTNTQTPTGTAAVTPTTTTTGTPTPTPTPGGAWGFYFANNATITRAPNNNGEALFNYSGKCVYNPNYTGGTFNIYFNNNNKAGTSYLSQFQTLNNSGGTITINQGSSTAIYSGTSDDYVGGGGTFLQLTVSRAAQMIQAAPTQFVSGNTINVVVS